MHAIKRRAHEEGWYNSYDEDDEEKKVWNPMKNVPNPWARQRPRRKGDPERGSLQPIQHVVTDGEINSPSDEARRKSFQNEDGTYGPPRAVNTFPGPYSASSHKISAEDGIQDIPQPSSSTEYSKDEKKEFEEAETPAEQNGLRKRKRDKIMPWRMAGKEDRDEKKAEKKKNQPSTKHLTVIQQFKNVFFSWINLMLVFVPVGIAMANIPSLKKSQPVVIFVMNFLAIIPLAGILSFATEELAKFIGEVLGGLLNASFGNAVELIVSIIALVQGKTIIVQTSLIGSMLSNLLLVMGMCFAFGGIGRQEQHFNVTVAQTAASLLALAIGGLIIPTAFKIFGGHGDQGVSQTSRGTAVMLLITYACYLIFQLKTHREVYNAPSEKVPRKSRKKNAAQAMASSGAVGAQVGIEHNVQEADEDDEEDPPLLTRLGALLTLAGSTVLVAICAEYMVSAIDALAKDISEEFIGLILLPIVGNAAEHATAVTVAIKDKMDLAIGVAIGSSLQIALLVLPLMVLFSWWGLGAGNGPELTLAFDGFQVSVLFIGIVLVNYLIQDGKSHWLEGILLEVIYTIIAIAAFFYPTPKQGS